MATNSEARQVLLRVFGETVAEWKKTGQQAHSKVQHKFHTQNLKFLLNDASERGDIDDTDLCQAAGISPEELRDIRDSLN